ncbi:MAG: 16S rRNA processing protein RimM [Flavobacteriia bacterium]|nr:16S rRNA processing protein RimM [Flavobacteriia bacterium]
MKIQESYLLGHIAKLHGFKGEVSLFLDLSHPEEFKIPKVFWIENDGQLIPFTVQQFQLKNKSFARVKFIEVNNENEAKKILRKKVYLPIELLEKLDDNHFYDHEIIAFDCIDEKLGLLGKIDQVIDLPSNPLLQINQQGKEILIPLIPGLVKKVDRKEKKLFILSPDGLFD